MGRQAAEGRGNGEAAGDGEVGATAGRPLRVTGKSAPAMAIRAPAASTATPRPSIVISTTAAPGAFPTRALAIRIATMSIAPEAEMPKR